MNKKKLSLIISGCFWVLLAFGQTGTAKISKSDWDVFSENNEAAEMRDTLYAGKISLKLDSKKQAIAIRKSLSLKNFRIDLDVAGEVMSGIGFRAADHQNYHFLYFRPGYGGTREAIQYVPIYNGALSWVLYNYPIYETAADIKKLEWFHVTMEVKGNNLKVFVNYNQTPQMEIQLIDTDFNEGSILLRSMFGTSYFSNVMIRERPELLSEWEISDQFPRKPTLDLNAAVSSKTWTKVKADQADVVNICRYIKQPDGVVAARHTFNSDTDREAILYFDFAGKLKIYLNGKEVFYYEKNKLDRIFNGTHQLVLNLKKGNNELIFITEGDASFFGKGFNAMGRLQHQNWGFMAEIGKK